MIIKVVYVYVMCQMSGVYLEQVEIMVVEMTE